MAEFNINEHDFMEERKQRQIDNYKKVATFITSPDFKKATDKEMRSNCINIDALFRQIEYLEFEDKEELYNYAISNPCAAKSMAMYIAKNTGRQGTIDEKTQINSINTLIEQLAENGNIDNGTCNNLGGSELRPYNREGRLITKQYMIENDIITNEGKGPNSCLKSIDFKTIINGTIKHYGFAKICFGGGGHQDSVFTETKTYGCFWINHWENIDAPLVLLIDTDRDNKFNGLKDNFKEDRDKVLVFNHVEYQQYLIDTYSV